MTRKVKKNISYGVIAAALIAPAPAFAAENIGSLLEIISEIISSIIPIVIGLAVLVFLFGVFKYVISNDEDAKSKGRDFMVWGIIGLFVMVSVWGLVNLLSSSLDLNNAAPNAPGLPS